MTKVHEHGAAMEAALVEQGWDTDRASDYVTMNGPRYAIRDEVDALEREYRRLRRVFKDLEIAPLFAALANGFLYLPKWYDPEAEGIETSDVQDQIC